jgi:3-carboxy-cis,cis-muconate cycloisomerase
VTLRIIDALGTTEALSEIFDDLSAIQALLDVEAALARVQSALGVIPAGAGASITRAAVAREFDAAALARDARSSGTLAVPLVAALTARVEALDPEAARFVHWGATSQDIVDTGMSLLIDRACTVMARDHVSISASLRELSNRHADTVMLGRTLLQPAPPITFGLKAAGWLASLSRSWRRVEQARRDAVRLQFGGASGTLAALGDRGPAIADAVARELGLPGADAPWHTSRDRLATLVSSCAITSGVLGKIARDISLLMQFEVDEAREAGGGSSTMPHKRNPSGCARVLAAAARLPGLAATMIAGLVQEHERSVGAWQAEWPVIAEALQATGAALEALGDVVANLSVDPDRMRANLDATRGAIFTERVMMLAGPTLGRQRAHQLLSDALASSSSKGGSLAEIVRSVPELAQVLSEADLRALGDPRAYLGAAEVLRQRLLASADEFQTGQH